MYDDVVSKRIGKEELNKVNVSWYYDGHLKSWIIKVFREDLGEHGKHKVFRFGKKNGEKVIELLKFILDSNGNWDDDEDDDMDDWGDW